MKESVKAWGYIHHWVPGKPVHFTTIDLYQISSSTAWSLQLWSIKLCDSCTVCIRVTFTDVLLIKKPNSPFLEGALPLCFTNSTNTLIFPFIIDTSYIFPLVYSALNMIKCSKYACFPKMLISINFDCHYKNELLHTFQELCSLWKTSL